MKKILLQHMQSDKNLHAFQERAMNQSYIKSFLIAAVLVVLMPCFALASPPHDTQTDCNTKCHQTHKTLGNTGYNNICLNCHRYGSSDPRYAQIYPYTVTDQSLHQTGPSLGVLKPGYLQSSHRWEGSDNNPRVGAVPPTNPALLGPNPSDPQVANMFVGALYCGRCHAVHGTNGYADSVSPPFLRIANNEDQMCLDCHKPRNVSSQQFGSHAVNVNYSSVAKRKSSEYFYPPLKAYSSNYTANMKIINGKVLCSTCHGVHHTDSNSRTFDNFSSVIFNGLSSSKGYLLRADLKGKNSSDRNICTTCHKTTDDDPDAKVKSHNGALKQQNIQCGDCHGGHVDEADGSAPNKFLIKRYMAYSSANSNGRNPKVMFLYTSISQRNYNGDQYGVCLACHKTLPNTIEQHTSTSTATCQQCHTHKAGFSANCTDCHGMPPREDVEGGPRGYAKGYNRAVNESLSPHQSHATGAAENAYYTFSCNDCHKAPQGVPQHGNGVYQDLFNSPNGTKAGILAAYDRTSRVCSNVYCHSNGMPAGQAAVYKTVTWANNKDSIITLPGSERCNSCHEAVPTTNAHTKHLTSGLLNGCVNCHANTVVSNTVLKDSARLTGGAHVNTYKDIRFTGTLGSSFLDGSSCATVYCHSDGKGTLPVVSPVWTDPSTGACGTCHAASNAVPADNDAHYAHLSAVYGPNLNAKGLPVSPTYNGSCNACHTYPTGHVNGSIGLPDNANCTVNCHKGDFPTWTLSGPTHRLDCATCHTTGTLSVIDGITAPPKAGVNFTTFGHGKPSINKICSDCHDPEKAHINSNPSVHDTRIRTEMSSGNDKCNYCHTNPSIVPTAAFRNMSTHFTTYGGPADMSCAICHDVHGNTNKSAIKTSFAFINSTTWTISYTNNTSVSSFVQPDGRGLCQVCHTKTDFYRAGAVGQSHNLSVNCLTCHKHNTSQGAFAPIGGGCDGCHGYPPIPKSSVKMSKTNPLYSSTYKTTYGFQGNYSSARFEDYSGGGGAHMNHVPDFARPSDEWTRCAVCHTGGEYSTAKPASHKMNGNLKTDIQNITINIDPAVKFNNSLQIIYSGAKLVSPPDNRTGSCMNISCHFQPSPRWSKDR